MSFLGKVGSSILGGVTSGVGSAIGTAFSSFATRSANQQAQSNLENAIQIRVADAKRAGIHPLYALGASASNFSPAINTFDTEGLQQMGQNIANAGADELSDFEQISQSQQIASNELQMENQRLENEKLKMEISGMGQKTLDLNPFNAVSSPFAGTAVPGQMATASNVATLSATKSPSGIRDDYGLDGITNQVQFLLQPNGYIGVAPQKDMIDWYSEGILPGIDWYAQLYQNAGHYRDLLQRHFDKRYGSGKYFIDTDYKTLTPRFKVYKGKDKPKKYFLHPSEMERSWRNAF